MYLRYKNKNAGSGSFHVSRLDQQSVQEKGEKTRPGDLVVPDPFG